MKLMTRMRLSISIAILILALFSSGCSFSLTVPGADLPPPITLNAPDYVNGYNSIAGALSYEDRQPPYILYAQGPVVTLTNNPAAKNPTWAELIDFVRADNTDRNAYLPDNYMCGGFAQDLHNNAEAAGIRAAWVAIDFVSDSIGHAATAFQTTDRGLVIIDDTSASGGGWGLGDGVTESFDKLAYIAIGQEYGIIALEVAASPLYNYYLDYLGQLERFEILKQEYEQQVLAYNQAARNGSQSPGYLKNWYQRLKDTESQLDEMAVALGGFYWQSMGIVSAVKIFW